MLASSLRRRFARAALRVASPLQLSPVRPPAQLLSRCTAPPARSRTAFSAAWPQSQPHAGWPRPPYRPTVWQRLDARPEAVLYGLLGANAAVFGLWQSGLASRAWLARHFTVSEANLRAGRWHTVVTAAFSHADVWHLLGNSFVLFFYGRELPGGRLLGLYLLGAVACSAAHVLAHSSLLRGRGEPARWWLAPPAPAALGASGAVNSLMVYSALVEPLRAVYMYGVLPVPAALLAAALLARDWVGASSGGSGTAHAGHLGGAAAGAAAWAYLRLRTRRRRVDW